LCVLFREAIHYNAGFADFGISMATQGEYDYFKNIGTDGMRHAAHKPWSDAQCGMYLMELGAMMGLMPEGGRLLDMGCGTGWTSVLFAKKGYRVVGQDLVPEAIDAARRLGRENSLDHLDFVVGDYESLAFENEFDVVVFFDCLHHAVDEVGALKSAYRALKPGGICITSEPGLGHERRSAAIMQEFGTPSATCPHPRHARARGRVHGAVFQAPGGDRRPEEVISIRRLLPSRPGAARARISVRPTAPRARRRPAAACTGCPAASRAG
jgi:SAM-dependent methyltransferase